MSKLISFTRNKETVPKSNNVFNVLTQRYLVAAWTVGIAFVATLLIVPFLPFDSSPLFLIAVMISAWRGGLRAGFLATVFATLANIFVFLPTNFSFSVDRNDISQILIDVFAAAIIGTLSAARRKAENEREALLAREQAARIEAEHANKVKDDFLAAVSHELRTPLTTIKTLTRVLLLKNPTAEERQEYLSDIASECERQIDLVHNLLDVSSIKSGGVQIKPQKVNVTEVLQACRQIERHGAAEHNHQFEIETAPDLPLAIGDGSALRRALCSMIENAIKYTPDGGAIKINASKAGENYLSIRVTDNGRGIHPDDLPHLFERFYRGHLINENGKFSYAQEHEIPGVGLGLHLAKILIEGMGGRIEVKSAVGQGSAFTIILPLWHNEIAVNKPEFENLVEKV